VPCLVFLCLCPRAIVAGGASPSPGCFIACSRLGWAAPCWWRWWWFVQASRGGGGGGCVGGRWRCWLYVSLMCCRLGGVVSQEPGAPCCQHPCHEVAGAAGQGARCSRCGTTPWQGNLLWTGGNDCAWCLFVGVVQQLLLTWLWCVEAGGPGGGALLPHTRARPAAGLHIAQRHLMECPRASCCGGAKQAQWLAGCTARSTSTQGGRPSDDRHRLCQRAGDRCSPLAQHQASSSRGHTPAACPPLDEARPCCQGASSGQGCGCQQPCSQPPHLRAAAPVAPWRLVMHGCVGPGAGWGTASGRQLRGSLSLGHPQMPQQVTCPDYGSPA
jgi:hypothetical protein